MRALALVLVAGSGAVAGCGDDGPPSPATAQRAVVEVTSQRCERPTVDSGWGVRVDGAPADEIVTAAHVVDGDLRDLRVAGVAADVVVIDPRTDLAVLRTRRPIDDLAPAVALNEHGGNTASSGDAWLVTGDAEPRPVDVQRTTTLVVDDPTAKRTYRRSAIVFDRAVPRGTSGAPVVDADGAVVGVTVLTQTAADISYATSAGEVATLLANVPSVPRHAGIDCARVR